MTETIDSLNFLGSPSVGYLLPTYTYISILHVSYNIFKGQKSSRSINMSTSEINIQIDTLVKSHDKTRIFNETKKAAEDENRDAQYNLASFYHSGEGTERDFEKRVY